MPEKVTSEKVEIFTVDIKEGGQKGVGLAHLQSGRICLVPKTLPGERVDIEVTQHKRRHVVARPMKWHKTSPERIEPVCKHFADCGGCHLQHMSYDQQLKQKAKFIEKQLSRLDWKSPVTVKSANRSLHYRNRNYLHVKNGKIGFISAFNKSVVDVDWCEAAPEANNIILRKVRAWIKDHNPMAIDVLIRSSTQTKCALLIIVIPKVMEPRFHQNPKSNAWKLSALGLDDRHSLFVNFKDPKDKAAFGEVFVHISGPEKMPEKVGSIDLLLSPASFVQIHTEQAAYLYEKAQELLNPAVNDTVLDLYAGSGGLAFHLSPHVHDVYSVELSHIAVSDAHDSAKLMGIENVSFRAGKCETIAEKLYRRGFRCKLATLNPPRPGCDEKVLVYLKDLGIERFVYVSCSPKSFARDAIKLRDLGYQMKFLEGVDMFPQTYHVEIISLWNNG